MNGMQHGKLLIHINKTKTMNEEIIKFAMYLTGHDEETIIQMYNDWKKYQK